MTNIALKKAKMKIAIVVVAILFAFGCVSSIGKYRVAFEDSSGRADLIVLSDRTVDCDTNGNVTLSFILCNVSDRDVFVETGPQEPLQVFFVAYMLNGLSKGTSRGSSGGAGLSGAAARDFKLLHGGGLTAWNEDSLLRLTKRIKIPRDVREICSASTNAVIVVRAEFVIRCYDGDKLEGHHLSKEIKIKSDAFR